jgi:hypothetical protein
MFKPERKRFSAIPLQICYAIAKTPLPQHEGRVLWAIIGEVLQIWGRWEAKVSLKQLSRLTRLDYRNTKRAVKGLIEKNIISVESSIATKITINRNPVSWKVINNVQKSPLLPYVSGDSPPCVSGDTEGYVSGDSPLSLHITISTEEELEVKEHLKKFKEAHGW